MPELPEVENVRRNLERLVVGRTIQSVDVRLPRIVRRPDDIVLFEETIRNHQIRAVHRRGKYLLFDLHPLTLVSHLRMEGQYRVADPDEPEALHTHVVFHLDNGSQLRYRDVRQFGTMDLVADASEYPSGLRMLGPEPFASELTASVLKGKLQSRQASIKATLLDQKILAGLGNIYVDEALFRSGLHPSLPANAVTQKQADELLTHIRTVLTEAIAAGGSSVRSFVDGYGRHGGFQMALDVYGREGESCRRCSSPIEKIRLGGRGTHFCPTCQRLPRSKRTRISRTTSVQ